MIIRRSLEHVPVADDRLGPTVLSSRSRSNVLVRRTAFSFPFLLLSISSRAYLNQLSVSIPFHFQAPGHFLPAQSGFWQSHTFLNSRV